MNFDFTEEQNMLRDSVAKFIQDQYTVEARRAIAESAAPMNTDNWRTFAELGWLSIPFAEDLGGYDGDAVDVMVILEQFGRGLVLEPYLATVLLFGGLLQEGGNSAQKDEYIPSIIEGSCQGAFAYLERQSRYELADVATTASLSGDRFILSGEKVVVFNGCSADHFIVLARTSGEQYDEDGLSLFLVPADAAGMRTREYQMMDGQWVANLVLDNVEVPAANLIGEQGAGYRVMQPVLLRANLALAAEALGVMGELNTRTLEYARTREQFGVAIGSFQALQHRMVDTFMAFEQTKSLLYRAVCAMTDEEQDATAVVHALRVMMDRAGKLVSGEAIQIHGGMGVTDELEIGHYTKRLMMINTTFGNGDFHQAKFNALSYS